MKKLAIFVLAIFVISFVMAQDMVIKTYVEQTSVSPKMGTAVGMETRYGFEYGGFYQESGVLESSVIGDDKSNLPRHYEKEFFGIYGAVPIVQRGSFDLKFNVRTGVTNGENFAITPSVLGRLAATGKIRLGAGLGFRALRPTYQGSVAIVL